MSQTADEPCRIEGPSDGFMNDDGSYGQPRERDRDRHINDRHVLQVALNDLYAAASHAHSKAPDLVKALAAVKPLIDVDDGV